MTKKVESGGAEAPAAGASISAAPAGAADAAGARGDSSLDRASAFVPAALAAAIAVGALWVGLRHSLALAIWVLAGGALLAATFALWSSLRLAFGDEGLDVDTTSPNGPLDALLERKRRALRQLKDLELERDYGKLNQDDFERLESEYRGEARAVLAELDEALAPHREKAEKLAKKHLSRPSARAANKVVASEAEAAEESVNACAKCGAANDVDAAFCKKCGNAMGAEVAS